MDSNQEWREWENPRYSSVWEWMKSWIERDEALGACLLNSREAAALKSATSVLSIGPGTGDLDHHLLQHVLSNVREYYAVDPNSEFLKLTAQKIGGLHNIKIHCLETSLEDANPPKMEVDIVLFANCISYVKAEVDESLQKMYNWLSPGGALICITTNPGNRRMMEEAGLPWRPLGEMLMVSVKKNGWKFTEYEAPQKIYFNWNNREEMKLMGEMYCAKQFSEHESNMFYTAVRRLAKPCGDDAGKGAITSNIMVVVITKLPRNI